MYAIRSYYEEHKKEVMADVQEKKSALKIEGKTVLERVHEFAKLNSLLAYHNRKQTFKQAKKEAKAETEPDIALLEAEALAELMLLELLSI